MADNASTITVIVADDHTLFREGLVTLLHKGGDVKVVAQAANGKELVEQCLKWKPQLVITDVQMPLVNGAEAAKQITKALPATGIIALSAFDEDNLIIEMLQAGARGYLIKNSSAKEFFQAIRSVLAGDIYYSEAISKKMFRLLTISLRQPTRHPTRLTEKETQIVRLICEQLSSKEIGVQLGIGVRTVESYREKIQKKLGVRSSIGLVLYAVKEGIYKI